MELLVNIDVADLDTAIRFYERAVGLRIGRRLFEDTVAEMLGASSPIYLMMRTGCKFTEWQKCSKEKRLKEKSEEFPRRQCHVEY